jgi:DNA-binding NarL/FixJ family response regulator
MDRGRGKFLLVEDEAIVVESLTRCLQAYGDTTVARTAADAMTALAAPTRWSAFFLDIGLPDGCGLEVLAAARNLHLPTPAVVLTGSHEPANINRAYDLGAQYLMKPIPASRLAAFLDHALDAHHRTARVVAAWAHRCDLSAADRDILLRAAMGEDRSVIAVARGTSPNTIKKQVARMLQKTGHDTLQLAVAALLREVVGV